MKYLVSDIALLQEVVDDYDRNLEMIRDVVAEDDDGPPEQHALIARMQPLRDRVDALVARLSRSRASDVAASVSEVLASVGRSSEAMAHGCAAPLSAVGTAPAPAVESDEQRGQSASDITNPANPLFYDPALQELQSGGDASNDAQRGGAR